MKETTFLKKVDELLERSIEIAKEKAREIPRMGVIDLESEPEGNYNLAKDAVMALLKEVAWQWGPQGCSEQLQKRSRRNTRKIYQQL